MNKEIKMKKVMAPSSIIVVLLVLLVFVQLGRADVLLRGTVAVLQPVNSTDWRIGIHNGWTITAVYTNVGVPYITNLQIARAGNFEVIMERHFDQYNGCWYVDLVEICNNPLPTGGYGPPPGYECPHENQVPWE